jgi:hypothetical protein
MALNNQTKAMTTLQSSTWSETLQQQTRDAIEQILVTLDGCIYFKHPRLGYAYATFYDLMQERLLLQAKTGDESYPFESVGALLKAGWAVD